MVQIEGLHKKYGRQTVLKNISLDIRERGVYGFMGENGAGKSTLFRCLAGLETYDGNIRFGSGEKTIGYFPDVPYYYSYVKGYEYIEFCLVAKGIHITRAEIDKANQMFGLPLERFATRYSMGMQKRLILLTLTLQDNDVYILDEPFNGLDLAGTLLLKKWIRSLSEQGKTILVSSHIISSLTDICHEIYYIHDGVVLTTYRGETAEYIERDITQHLFKLVENPAFEKKNQNE